MACCVRIWRGPCGSAIATRFSRSGRGRKRPTASALTDWADEGFVSEEALEQFLREIRDDLRAIRSALERTDDAPRRLSPKDEKALSELLPVIVTAIEGRKF